MTLPGPPKTAAQNDGGLPIVRLASGTINASVQDVASCWWQVDTKWAS